MGRPLTPLCLIALLALLASGCDKISDETKEQARSAGQAALESAQEAGRAAIDYGSELWDNPPDPGELSDASVAWLEAKQASAGASIEGLVLKGEQATAAAREIGDAVGQVWDSDTQFEPIYRPLPSDADRAEVDRLIGDMPQAEVVDGLTIGYESMSGMRNATHESHSAYLILWRTGDVLMGFVLRSRRDLDLLKVGEMIPRIVAAAQAVE